MSFEALSSALFRGELLSVLAWMAVVALVLFLRRPEDRASLRNTLVLALISMGGIWIADQLRGLGFESGADIARETFVVLLGLVAIRLSGQFVFRVLLPLARPRPPRILEDLVVMVAYVIWGFVRLRLAGLDLSGIVATSAVITAIIAFSVQDTLGNILGGLALELDSGFEIGDWIRVDDVSGRVVDVRWRSVSIQTRNWETVVVPNSHMVRSKVTVLGRRSGGVLQMRRWVWFSVPLSASPAKVISVVEAAMRNAAVPNVAATPAPNAVLMEFERGYARYALRYWLTDFERDDLTDSGMREHILVALQRAGMRIAVAEERVHVIAEDRLHAEQVAERELAVRMEVLKSIDLFGELSDDEIQMVAAGLEPAPFATGDLITRQGAVAHWLYLLATGEVSVEVEGADGVRHPIAALQGPTVFGEMGLLTGEPRHATVIARAGCECYRLQKAVFEDVLVKRPSLADRMSRILAERQNSLEQKSVDLAARADDTRRSARMSNEILGQIRRFFGITSS